MRDRAGEVHVAKAELRRQRLDARVALGRPPPEAARSRGARLEPLHTALRIVGQRMERAEASGPPHDEGRPQAERRLGPPPPDTAGWKRSRSTPHGATTTRAASMPAALTMSPTLPDTHATMSARGAAAAHHVLQQPAPAGSVDTPLRLLPDLERVDELDERNPRRRAIRGPASGTGRGGSTRRRDVLNSVETTHRRKGVRARGLGHP